MSDDIVMLRAQIMDSILLGDHLQSNTQKDTVNSKLKTDIEELEKKKKTLEMSIRKKQNIIERSDRDFSDVKDLLPETPQKQFLHFIEDYTLAFLTMSYLFMTLAIIYIYTTKPYSLTPGFHLPSLAKGIFGSILITIFMYVLLYYFS